MGSSDSPYLFLMDWDLLIWQDFDKVWPIFDSAQSRDFRKVDLVSLFWCEFLVFVVLFMLKFVCVCVFFFSWEDCARDHK